MTETFRTASRRDFSRSSGATTGDLQLGCLQRIADACETMARENDRLIRDAKYQREERERLSRRLDLELRRSAAYRGLIARMKRKGGAS